VNTLCDYFNDNLLCSTSDTSFEVYVASNVRVRERFGKRERVRERERERDGGGRESQSEREGQREQPKMRGPQE
jgi:hypothetical protein